jgi:hypothetical protein
LLKLYDADAEYSADALEGIYDALNAISARVLREQVDDQTASDVLTAIAREEDLNGRIRRNVMDTRRALSFMMRSRMLSARAVRRLAPDPARHRFAGQPYGVSVRQDQLPDGRHGRFININQNKIIKIFSVASVGLLPPTLIASIYGMNFAHMPELSQRWGLSVCARADGGVGCGTVFLLPSQGLALIDGIRAVSLDLDDTLWPIAPVIARAELELHAWFQHHAPATAALFDVATLVQLRDAIAGEFPDRAHDFTWMRKLAIERGAGGRRRRPGVGRTRLRVLFSLASAGRAVQRRVACAGEDCHSLPPDRTDQRQRRLAFHWPVPVFQPGAC